MSEEPTAYTAGAMTTPQGWDDAPLPKRNGHRGMLPSTWLNRHVRVEYAGADGKAAKTSGVLLDLFPAGPVLNIGGAKTCLLWERLVLLELVSD